MTDATESAPVPAGPTLRQVGAWTAELLRVPGGLLAAYAPGRRGVSARTREQLIIAVAERNGVRSAAWVHGAWLDFLGARAPEDALAPLFDYARSCAEAGVPLDTTTLHAVYPRALVRSVRATVAVAQLKSAAGAPAEQLWARARRGRGGPLEVVGSALGFGLSLPWLASSLAVAGAMRTLSRLAPPLPRVELPPGSDANLVAHLLAEAAPAYLGHAVVRTAVALLPLPVAIGFRMDGTSATIRLGRGRVAVTNGVEPDAVVVVDGGVEPLLELVAGSILRDLGVPVRRRH